MPPEIKSSNLFPAQPRHIRPIYGNISRTPVLSNCTRDKALLPVSCSHIPSDTIRAQATLHGLKQKLVDAAAIARDTATGRSATSADKEAAVMEVYNRITAENGTWNKIREAGATAAGGLLVAALMQMTGKTKPEIIKYLETKTAEQKAALRKNQKVAAIILELQQAAANPNIDSDALLGELMPGVEDVAEEALGDDLKHTAEEPSKPKRSKAHTEAAH